MAARLRDHGRDLNISGSITWAFVNWTIRLVRCYTSKGELLLRQATYLPQLRFQRGTLVRWRVRQLRSKLLPLFLPVTPLADFGWPQTSTHGIPSIKTTDKAWPRGRTRRTCPSASPTVRRLGKLLDDLEGCLDGSEIFVRHGDRSRAWRDGSTGCFRALWSAHVGDCACAPC